MEPVKILQGDRLIEKIYMVFTLAKAGRDEAAATVLQQVFDELRESSNQQRIFRYFFSARANNCSAYPTGWATIVDNFFIFCR